MKFSEKIPSAKNKNQGCRAMLSILTVTGLMVVISMIPAREGMSSSMVRALPVPSKPSCDTRKAAALIRKLKQEGIIYSIDAPSGLYPRVYVTESWYALPMDQKRAVDGVLYCWGSNGGAKDIIVKYYDYRTEKKIALGGRDGLSLK